LVRYGRIDALGSIHVLTLLSVIDNADQVNVRQFLAFFVSNNNENKKRIKVVIEKECQTLYSQSSQAKLLL